MTSIMVVSDIHYLAPEYYQGSQLFLRALANSDGKLTQHSEVLIQALKREVLAKKPDALLITGDLSLNGEKLSHIRLASHLREIRDAGIPVWIIPGNHDINSTCPRRYEAEKWLTVDTVSPTEFRQIYQGMMMQPSGCFDANLTYSVRVSEKVRVLMLDTCCYRQPGMIAGVYTAGHHAWIQRALDGSRREHAVVLTASHHGLIPHTQFAYEHFVIQNRTGLLESLAENGIRLHVSGHLHAQHIAHEGTLTDAATGGFCITPHRYAWIEVSGDDRITYTACALSEAYLPDGFQRASEAWFMDVARRKNLESISALPLDAAQKQSMAEFSARFNLAFFTGSYQTCDPRWAQETAYALWQQYPAGIFGRYFTQVIHEYTGENLRFQT